MPQFAVHRNRNAATKGRFPLLLDVQTEQELAHTELDVALAGY